MDEFEFGYKLRYQHLDQERSEKICIVEPKEKKGAMDIIKTYIQLTVKLIVKSMRRVCLGGTKSNR